MSVNSFCFFFFLFICVLIFFFRLGAKDSTLIHIFNNLNPSIQNVCFNFLHWQLDVVKKVHRLLVQDTIQFKNCTFLLPNLIHSRLMREVLIIQASDFCSSFRLDSCVLHSINHQLIPESTEAIHQNFAEEWFRVIDYINHF